jgi:hypothetical protein
VKTVCSRIRLNKKEKIKHLEYIKEKADTYQCLGYILDGKFYNLNEQGKQEIKDRFIKEGKTKERRKTAMSVAGITGTGVASAGLGGYLYHKVKPYIKDANKIFNTSVTKLDVGKSIGKGVARNTVIGAAGWAAYRGIRAIFDECTRKCGTLKINTAKRQECLKKCKSEYLQKKLKIDKQKNEK